MKIRDAINYKLVLLVVSIAALTGQLLSSHQETFLEANELYKQGKFQEAYDRYVLIPNKSAFVLYNLGNCAYKLGWHGRALAHWRRAERSWGVKRKGELLENIAILRKHDKTVSLYDYVVSFLYGIPVRGVQISFLLVWFLFFIVLKMRRRRSYVLAAFLFFFVILCGTILAVKYTLDTSRYGVVLKKDQLLSGPAKSFQVLDVVSEADEVVIERVSSGYFKIALKEKTGWIAQESIEEI